MDYKLGKKPARHGAIALRLANLIDESALPKIPDSFGHDSLIDDNAWGMLGNDKVGNCVFAGAEHETMLLARIGGKSASFTTANALADYSAVTGYDPKDPQSDAGTDMQEAASYRRRVGLIDAQGQRHKIAAYVALDPGNIRHIFYALYLFDVAGIGIMLPSAALDQTDKGKPWDVVGTSRLEGGHYVPLVAKRGLLKTISWGKPQFATARFISTYCDEAVAYVSEEAFIERKSSEGFDYDKVLEYLKTLGK